MSLLIFQKPFWRFRLFLDKGYTAIYLYLLVGSNLVQLDKKIRFRSDSALKRYFSNNIRA